MRSPDKSYAELMNFREFTKNLKLSMQDVFRDIYLSNRENIKIKKQNTAVKNLETIFNATLSLANRKGFQSMSMRDLAAESGLSMGALYSYFKGKDELIDIIQTQSREVVARVFDEYIKEDDDPLQKLKTAIRVHLYLSEVMREWFYFSYMESKNLAKPEQKKAIEGELFTEQVFVDIIKDGIKENIFKTESPILVGSALKAMLQDWYLKRWKYSGRKISIDTYALFITDIVEGYICTK